MKWKSMKYRSSSESKKKRRLKVIKKTMEYIEEFLDIAPRFKKSIKKKKKKEKKKKKKEKKVK